MDIVLELTDTYVLDKLYSAVFPITPLPYDFPVSNYTVPVFSTWEYTPATKYLRVEPSEAAYTSMVPRDNIYRQAVSLWLITWIFGILVYFIFSTLSFYFIFDKRTLKHPKFLKNQIWLEIKQASAAMPYIALFTAPFFLLEVRGYSKLYDAASDAPGLWYNFIQFPFFLVFTDFWIYWIHRGLHNRRIYKHLHKAHHKWIMPTPFASHAFHPLDGFAQSIPYHVFPLLLPLQKIAYIVLFIFINIWTIMIHDGEYLTNNPVVNGAACHSLHHSKFEVNYGQFFTFVDRIGGTYLKPETWMFQKSILMSEKKWKSEVSETERIVHAIEGDDERTYDDGLCKKTN